MKHLKNERDELLMPGYIYDIIHFPSMKYFRFDNKPCDCNYRLDLQCSDTVRYNYEMNNLYTLTDDIDHIITNLTNGNFFSAHVRLSKLFFSIKIMNEELINELFVAIYGKGLDDIENIKEVNINANKLRNVIEKILDLRIKLKRDPISTYTVEQLSKCHICGRLAYRFQSKCVCYNCNRILCDKCGRYHGFVRNSYHRHEYEKHNPICLLCFHTLKRNFKNFDYCDKCHSIYKRKEINDVILCEEYKPTIEELRMIDSNDNYLITCKELLNRETVYEIAKSVDGKKFISALQSYYLDPKLIYPRLINCIMNEESPTFLSFTKDERREILMKPLLIRKYWNKILHAIFNDSDENLESLLKLYEE